MDGVDGPMAVSATGGKGLDPDGFGEIGEGGCGAVAASAGAERSGTGEYCLRRDTEHETINLEHASYSTDVRSEDLYDRLFHSFKQEANDTYHRPGESESFHFSPKSECKRLQRKKVKGPNSSPTSKRPRTEQLETHSGPYITKCTAPDKLRLPKDTRQRVVQDGKRCERKNSRGTGKGKPDTFASKNGSVSDFGLGANNILGIHGIKLDFHDCTKEVDEPSLTALLDDTYSCPIFCQSKGKKGSSGTENIVLAVKKACSVLSQHSLTDSSNKEALVSTQVSNDSSINVAEHGSGDRSVGEWVPFTKDDNIDILNQSLYRPSDVLDRLALPRVEGLGSLLHDLYLNSTDLLHRTDSNIFESSLPLFSWSSVASCKLSTDAGKLATSRYLGQSRWAKIGNSNVVGEGPSCFSELVQKSVDHIEFPSQHNKRGKLLQEVKSLTMSYSLPHLRLAGSSCEAAGIPTADNNVLDNDGQRKGFSTQAKSSDRFLDFGTKKLHNREKESKDNFWYQENGSEPVDPSAEISGKNNLDSSSRSKEGSSRPMWHAPTAEISKTGHSSQVLAAAETLLEIACSDVPWKQNKTNEKPRWPSPPLHMAMKPRLPKPPLAKMEGALLESRTIAQPRTARVPSPQHKSIQSDKKTKFPCMKNASRDVVRWSSVGEPTHSLKLERDSSVNSKTPFSSPSKHVDFMMPPSRVDKGRDEHKPRKDMMGIPSYTKSFGVKDWNRGRSRRE